MPSIVIGGATLHHADCREVLRSLPDNSIDSVVTDPPYALVSITKRFGKPGAAPAQAGADGLYARASAGFMGKSWDTGETAFAVEFWAEVLRVLKPGGHVVAFSGTRTYHRMVCAVEDAGFEIRDQLGWLYGSGFPKSHDVAKGIDRELGAVRDKVRHKPRAETSGTMAGSADSRPWIEQSRVQGYHEVDGPEPVTPAPRAWKGWGTALKPSWEPIVLARKPLIGTVAENVLQHGTGALNVDGCRVGDSGGTTTVAGDLRNTTVCAYGDGLGAQGGSIVSLDVGRWPANILHDGSDDVLDAFPGEESRFFYCAKASRRDREEGLEGWTSRPAGGMSGRHDGSLGSITMRANTHPTVKPTRLMQWLCRLITPPGGTVLDPFMGSGSTGKAALLEGFSFIGCEREDEYMPIAAARIGWALGRVDSGDEEPSEPVAPVAAQAQPKPEPANDNAAPPQMSLFA